MMLVVLLAVVCQGSASLSATSITIKQGRVAVMAVQQKQNSTRDEKREGKT